MRLGITDLPLTIDQYQDENSKDLLNISNYIQGLKKFILNCPTPMSIAIQGDWGTGKTSIMNCLNYELLKDEEKVKTINFNTWQYSQFKMDENLYVSFLSCLIDKMSKNSVGKKIQDSAKNILKFILKTGKNIIPYGENLDEDSLLEMIFKNQIDQAQNIAKIRDEFQKTVKEFLDDREKRLVIFIDDLDRLNPNVAVELLEAIKLFLDVNQCVFILAIDYDVVVQGVRKKFGNDVSLEKCKSFFDKIIQLPFRMPVESYNLKELLKAYLNEWIPPQYFDPLSLYLKNIIGANPRTFKRLVNSFVLIQSVLESKNKTIGQMESAMLLSALSLQMSVSELYSYLLSTSDWIEEEEYLLFNEFFESKQTTENIADIFKDFYLDYGELTNRKIEQLERSIENIGGFLKVLYEYEKEHKDQSSFLRHFKEVISMSSITSVTTNTNITKSERKVNKVIRSIIVEGIQKEVKDATAAIISTFQIVLQKHKEMLPFCIEKIHILTDDESKNNSVFRAKTKIEVGTDILYIGTSTNFNDKCRYTDKLSSICGLEEGSIRWSDGNEIVYINKK